MKKYLLKSFCLLALMFISVLTGIQVADNGIHHLQGSKQTNSFYTPFSNRNKAQSLSVNQLYSHDIQVKQKKLEQMNSFNFYSFMGEKFSDGISNASAKIIKSIVK